MFDAPKPPVAPGELLSGRYQVQRLIAWGGMGVVYEAKDIALQRKVALKVVRNDFATNEEAVARFLNEARAAATLKSEHAAKVLDVGQLESGTPYMVMEHLEGADLATILNRERPLPMQHAVDYILQACEAVAEAHAAGIIHRDIKPENLFVSRGPDGSDVVKVLDFGISKRLKAAGTRSITNPASSIGSPLYMSPEQMKSPSNVDARSDVWSIGAVLFELVAGRSPFDADSVPEICAKVLSEPAPSLRDFRPELPEALAAVVMRCLEKEPERRVSSVAQLAIELEPFGSIHAPQAVRRIALIEGRPSLISDAGGERRSTPVDSVLSNPGNPAQRRSRLRELGMRMGPALAAIGIFVAVGFAGMRYVQDKAPPARPALGAQIVSPPPPTYPAPAPDVTASPAARSVERLPAKVDTGAGAPKRDEGDERFPTQPRTERRTPRGAANGGSLYPQTTPPPSTFGSEPDPRTPLEELKPY
jgi:serine/threonine-protein kinase